MKAEQAKFTERVNSLQAKEIKGLGGESGQQIENRIQEIYQQFPKETIEEKWSFNSK